MNSKYDDNTITSYNFISSLRGGKTELNNKIIKVPLSTSKNQIIGKKAIISSKIVEERAKVSNERVLLHSKTYAKFYHLKESTLNKKVDDDEEKPKTKDNKQFEQSKHVVREKVLSQCQQQRIKNNYSSNPFTFNSGARLNTDSGNDDDKYLNSALHSNKYCDRKKNAINKIYSSNLIVDSNFNDKEKVKKNYVKVTAAPNENRVIFNSDIKKHAVKHYFKVEPVLGDSKYRLFNC